MSAGGWWTGLGALATRETRAELLAGRPMDDAVAVAIHASILQSLHHDLERAKRFNEGLQQWLEHAEPSSTARAWAARSAGHIHHTEGRYEEAIECYAAAAHDFLEAGGEVEYARTLLGGMQALIYRGRYDEAIEWAERARGSFEKHNDALRLARLESNIGNVLFRQDKPQLAAERYRAALAGFAAAAGAGAADAAATLSNLAVASISLGHFDEALESYQKARAHYELFGPANLLARAEYNVAYLYYMRGQYSEARTLYQVSRERCTALGDPYHAALCDLDEGEMLLELNLTRESEHLSRRASAAFLRLGLRYERGKALVNQAAAGSQRRDLRFAERKLKLARRLFVDEKNAIWAALADQLRAVLAFHKRRFHEAKRLSESAWKVLNQTLSPGRAAHSQILLARLWLRAGYTRRALETSSEAVARAGEWVSPSLRFHSSLVRGEIHESHGRVTEALSAYEEARLEVEDLRGRLETEDLRISLLHDKLSVYEGLVSLHIESADITRALGLVEQAKSRSLADRLALEAGNDSTVDRVPEPVEALRRDLNFLYRKIEAGSTEAGARLRGRAVELETALLEQVQRRRKVDASGQMSLSGAGSDSLIRAALGAGELVIEFYEARDQLFAFVLDRDSLQVVALGAVAPVKTALKLLRFQITRLGFARELDAGRTPDPAPVREHLRELYTLLISPVEPLLTSCSHLILAPHRELHGLPFAALDDGSRALIDRFTLSATPSALVLAMARRRRRAGDSSGSGALVMAVPDSRAPRIAEEAEIVAGALPGSRVFLGRAATAEKFRSLAPQSRVVHLATHGIFRRDNPMFSALEMADERFHLLDLSHLRLRTDLLTLSACNTGSGVAIGGDELVGLVRGFLEAGAKSLLATLWEIDDTSAREFMGDFYRRMAGGESAAKAVRGAMLSARERFPHPYHWAAYLLAGEPTTLIAVETIP